MCGAVHLRDRPAPHVQEEAHWKGLIVSCSSSGCAVGLSTIASSSSRVCPWAGVAAAEGAAALDSLDELTGSLQRAQSIKHGR
jgi:hypothetical protein